MLLEAVSLAEDIVYMLGMGVLLLDDVVVADIEAEVGVDEGDEDGRLVVVVVVIGVGIIAELDELQLDELALDGLEVDELELVDVVVVVVVVTPGGEDIEVELDGEEAELETDEGEVSLTAPTSVLDPGKSASLTPAL